MKQFTLIIIISTLTITGFGQSLFFDNIYNSSWKTEFNCNDSTLRQTKEIGLTRLSNSKDSLKTNVKIWTFEEYLTISYFDFSKNKDSLVTKFKYEVDKNNSLLYLIISEKEKLKFEVGIISTGNFVLLMRKKK